jgi:hypothetical protein
LYGCEIWSVILTKERRERIIENSVLRRIFGPKKEKVRGRQRNLHNEEFHDHVKGDEETEGTWQALE